MKNHWEHDDTFFWEHIWNIKIQKVQTSFALSPSPLGCLIPLVAKSLSSWGCVSPNFAITNTPTSSLAWVPIDNTWRQWDLDFCGPAPTSKPQPSYHFGEPWEPTGTGNPRPSTSHYLVYYYSRDWLGLVFENFVFRGCEPGVVAWAGPCNSRYISVLGGYQIQVHN